LSSTATNIYKLDATIRLITPNKQSRVVG